MSAAATPALSIPAPTPEPASRPANQPASFLDRLAIYLMPYFLTMTPDRALAHSDIVETLQSCGARTRFELIIAAKAMACDLSALDIMAESKIMDMSASMRLRYAICAGGLGRLGRQTQQMLDRRLARDPVESDAAVPAASSTPVAFNSARTTPTKPVSLAPILPEPAPNEPVNDIADAEVEATLQSMQANVQAYCNRLAPIQPPTDRPAAGLNTNPPIHPSAKRPNTNHPNTNHPNANPRSGGNPMFDAADALAGETLAAQAAAAQAAAAKVLAAHAAATQAASQGHTRPS